MPRPGKWSQPRLDGALALALLLVGMTVGAWLVFVWPRPAVKYDAVEYLKLGQSLATGLGYRYGLDSYPTAYRPPLYPFLLAAALFFSGGALGAAYLLQAALHGVTVAATFVLARLLLPRAYAVAAALLAALSIGLTSLVGFLMTETVQAALTTAGMAATLWWLRGTVPPAVVAAREDRNVARSQAHSPLGGGAGLGTTSGRAALVGLLWGLAALAKGANLLVLALLPLALALGWRRAWRRWLSGYAAACGVALLVLAPWSIRNWALFGHPVFISTNTGIQLYISTLDPFTWDASDPRLKRIYDEARARNLNEAETDRLFLQHALAAIVQDPAGLLRRMAGNATRLYELPPRDAIEYLKPTVLYNDLPEYQWVVRTHYALLAAAALGFVLALVRRRRELVLVWLVPLSVALVYAPFWVIYRFTAPALPVLYVAAAAAVWLAADRTSPAPCSATERGSEDGMPRAPASGQPTGIIHCALRMGKVRLVGRAGLALWVIASAVICWQAHRPGWAVESAHPYRPNSDLVWAIVNPDDAAQQTRIHFAAARLATPGDRLLLLSSDFAVLEELDPNAFLQGGWTRPHPGRIIVVKLLTDGDQEDWGFRVDGVDSGE